MNICWFVKYSNKSSEFKLLILQQLYQYVTMLAAMHIQPLLGYLCCVLARPLLIAPE
jgi:hypothetical protein